MSSFTERAPYPERLAVTPDVACEFPTEAARAAFQSLRKSGPDRFSQVTPTLYRGGQPTEADLVRLGLLGVNTVLNLRREERRVRRAEANEVTRLGMRFFSFPYYGVFGGSGSFFTRILDAMRNPEHGVVYVHCRHGRDRTSLAIALHLVVDQGWSPDLAWKRAAIEYGHKPTFWYSEMRGNFDKMVRRLRVARAGRV